MVVSHHGECRPVEQEHVQKDKGPLMEKNVGDTDSLSSFPLLAEFVLRCVRVQGDVHYSCTQFRTSRSYALYCK